MTGGPPAPKMGVRPLREGPGPPGMSLGGVTGCPPPPKMGARPPPPSHRSHGRAGTPRNVPGEVMGGGGVCVLEPPYVPKMGMRPPEKCWGVPQPPHVPNGGGVGGGVRDPPQGRAGTPRYAPSSSPSPLMSQKKVGGGGPDPPGEELGVTGGDPGVGGEVTEVSPPPQIQTPPPVTSSRAPSSAAAAAGAWFSGGTG